MHLPGVRIAALAVLLLGLVAGAAASSVDPSGPSGRPRVIANGEMLLGVFAARHPGVALFAGIPFAQAPVGELRWRAPQPHVPRAGVLEASRFAVACYQDGYNTDWYREVAKPFGADPARFHDPAVSEDCLYLNVWTPAPGAAAHLPVMVWIHGGSNKSGWSFEPNYDGENLAARERVVVVSVAYRLGIFGFFGHPLLRGAAAPANFGLLDQIAALHWVHDQIARFGGDPANVTVFGESAGAEDIGYLTVSPLAHGLFQRAIGESGGYFLRDTADLSAAERIGTALSQALPGHPGVREMRRMTSGEIFAAAKRALPTVYYQAVVDGKSLTMPPAAYYRRLGAPVDLLIGSNENEYYMYEDGDPASLARDLKSLPEPVRAALARRVAEEPSVRRGHDKALALADMACPPYLMAESAARAGHRAWIYRFSRVRAGPGGAALLAYHGAEIPYVFDTHDSWLPVTREDRTLTAAMMSYWANFARSGDPNGAALVPWPEYRDSEARVLDLGAPIRAVDAPDKALCDQVSRDLYPD